AVPVVPVIVSIKLDGVGTAVQLTVNVVPATVAVHDDVGEALVENATVPLKPLIAVKDRAEVRGVPTTTLSVDGVATTLKSTTWNVTGGVDVCDKVPLIPVTVAV